MDCEEQTKETAAIDGVLSRVAGNRIQRADSEAGITGFDVDPNNSPRSRFLAIRAVRGPKSPLGIGTRLEGPNFSAVWRFLCPSIYSRPVVDHDAGRVSGLVQHVEFQALLNSAERLRGEVAARLTELHELQHVVKPNLLAVFQAKLGPWELKLLSAQCETARLKRKIALAVASLNRQQAIDWAQIEQTLEREFLTWKARIEEAAAKVKEAEHHLAYKLSAADSAEIKKLYHQLVKALHPDIHPRQGAKEKQLWQQVQDAYHLAHLPTLRALAASLESIELLPDTPSAMDELKKQIASLEHHLAGLVQQLDSLKATPPFNMQEQLLSDTWIETRRAEIDTECAALQNLRAQLEAHLKVVAAHPNNGSITGLN
jgi:hypothetical protein